MILSGRILKNRYRRFLNKSQEGGSDGAALFLDRDSQFGYDDTQALQRGKKLEKHLST